jgi:hypothetical protein
MISKMVVRGSWLVAVAVFLCFAQGVNAQSAKLNAFAAGISAFPGTGAAVTGCGFYSGSVPAAPVRPEKKSSQAGGESGKPSQMMTSGQEPQSVFEGGAGIVGMWKFTFTSEGSSGIPDGTLIDQGYTVWHADGTEITNSGRPPITGNFCLGVWRQTSRSSFKLNHFGLSWDPTGATLIGPANIKEQVTVGHGGNSYTGTFTIDQFDTNGNLLAHIQGSIAAERITVD